MTLYRNKYRIESARYQKWNYGSGGIYFITIDTQDMMRVFGKIEDGKIELSDIGKIALKYWLEIPKHFDNVKLDKYIIMPNHIHGILDFRSVATQSYTHSPSDPTTRKDALHERLYSTNPHSLGQSSSQALTNSAKETPRLGVYTGVGEEEVKRKWQPGSLGVVINQYKRICTLKIRKKNPYFAWHSRFHDRIIRTDKELYNVREYIRNNPLKWCEKWEENK